MSGRRIELPAGVPAVNEALRISFALESARDDHRAAVRDDPVEAVDLALFEGEFREWLERAHAADSDASGKRADTGTAPEVAAEIFFSVSVVVLSPFMIRYICMRLIPTRMLKADKLSPVSFKCWVSGCVSLLMNSCNVGRDRMQEVFVTFSVTTT